MKTTTHTLMFAAAALCPAVAVAEPPEDLFFTQQGSLPILLLSGHGGSEQPDDIALARMEDDAGDLITNDFRTDLLTAKAIIDLENLLGGDVYYVISDIDRQYLDLNRDKTIDGTIGNAAFEDPDAEAYYDYYHGTANAYIADILAKHGGGLLIDVHGQGAVPDTVFRGTRNGDTVTDMLANFGDDALIGPNSVFGQLEALGYTVAPDNVPLDIDPEILYIGGYTVETYGSQNPGGIDSLQIEFGSEYRFDPDPNAWFDTGADLATAIAAYYTTYLVPEPSSLALLGFAGLLLSGRRGGRHALRS
ncbi:MAG: N-formylglutamate amidohydrolase [Planctomycetota bacterium]